MHTQRTKRVECICFGHTFFLLLWFSIQDFNDILLSCTKTCTLKGNVSNNLSATHTGIIYDHKEVTSLSLDFISVSVLKFPIIHRFLLMDKKLNRKCGRGPRLVEQHRDTQQFRDDIKMALFAFMLSSIYSLIRNVMNPFSPWFQNRLMSMLWK